MIIVVPGSLLADDSGAAMLHNNGGVLLNGIQAPVSSAVFPGDLVQTQAKFEATLEAGGTSVIMQSETLVRYESDELYLDHGMLLVSTARGVRVRAGCVTAIPAALERTQYDVTDVDGKVIVAAHKNDVNIDRSTSGSPKSAPPARDTVHEGEQKVYEDKCLVNVKPPAYVNARGAILNSPWAKWSGVVVVGVVTCLALCHGDDPVSPYKP